MKAVSKWVVDVDAERFSAEVLERSRSVPVLVDFWAPWCGPCRTLGPVLEKLAGEKEGRFLLAKINSDDHPELSRRYQVRSIPAVKLFIDGEAVAEFVGAQPESSIRKFLDKHIPSESDRLAEEGGKHAEAGEYDQAEALYRAALAREPTHYQGILGMSWVLMKTDRLEAARTLFATLSGKAAQSEGAKILRAKLTFAGAEAGLESLEERVAAAPDDLSARLALAQALVARESYAEGMDQFLELIRRDRKFQDDAGRKGVLQVFDLLGPTHPLVRTYRSRLSSVLFS